MEFELLSRFPAFVLAFSSLNSLTLAFPSVFFAVSRLATELLTSIGVGKQSAGRSDPGLRMESNYNFYYLFLRSLSIYFIYLFTCIFILLSRESDQCAIRARLGVAGLLSTTPRWGNPAKCLFQRHNK